MPSIFLSHTSIDKPFVEKLAMDLRRMGVNAWYDKWDIKVGESITWRIEEGIRESEYLGIILSPEALNSEWVKSEIGAGWVKQILTKKIMLLPIYYRDCDVPYFLLDRKYANFSVDYQSGLEELANVLRIENTNVISIENWRKFTRNKLVDWKKFREKEFESLVTTLVNRAKEYNWSSWVGGKRSPFSITCSAFIDRDKKQSVSIRLDGKSYAYLANLKDEVNPNNIKISHFTIYVGNTINECEEFVWRKMEDFKNQYGKPTGKANHFTAKLLGSQGRIDLAKKIIKDLNWYKGDN